MDLFSPLVPESEWHPNFKVLMTPGFGDAERATVLGWANNFRDRDGKFVKEFQTTFNSSFWELYLNATFQMLGYSIDYSVNRPDFVLSHPTQELTAEAVIASNSEGHRPEWDRPFEIIENHDRTEVIDLATIRIANSIWSKYQKFKSGYESLSHVSGKPFVICVAPFEQPLFFVQNDHALRRVLYGYDQPLWITGPDGSKIIVGEARLDNAIKDNGAVIPLGFFSSANRRGHTQSWLIRRRESSDVAAKCAIIRNGRKSDHSCTSPTSSPRPASSNRARMHSTAAFVIRRSTPNSRAIDVAV